MKTLKYFSIKKIEALLKEKKDVKKELRAMWVLLCKTHHPDNGGSTEVMQKINAEFDDLMAYVFGKGTDKERKGRTTEDYKEENEKWRKTLYALLGLGVTVELAGSWLWFGISKEDTILRAKIKDLGCKWSPKKALWYWRANDEKRKRFAGSRSMETIRNTYGSQTFKPSSIRKK